MDNQPSTTEEIIYSDLRQFLRKTSKDLEDRLASYPCHEFLKIIKNQEREFQVRQAACSVLKLLIYNKTFISQPLKIFQEVVEFYLVPKKSLLRIQETSEIVIQQIMSIYFNKTQKQEFALEYICKTLKDRPQLILKKLKLLCISIETLEPQSMNDEIIIGQLVLFWKELITSQIEPDQQIEIIGEIIKNIKTMINIIDEVDEDENIPQSYLRTSQNGKQLLEHIILLQSNNVQVITSKQPLNIVKLKALQLYTETWLYFLEEKMFYAFLNSMVSCRKPLYDEQAEIMEKIINLLDRSIDQNSYHEILHTCIIRVITALLRLLEPTQSSLSLIEQDPNQYVYLIDDFCKKQESQNLFMRVGSLLSSLCQMVDGYSSFVGSLCMIVIKKFDNSSSDRKFQEFMINIDKQWKCSYQTKLDVCLLLAAALSDQFEKRKDISFPIMITMKGLKPYFQTDPYMAPNILCKWMNLYAFYAFPGCLNPFLKYKNKKLVYSYQLEQCYQTMEYYHTRKGQEYEEYIQYIGKTVIISEHLTPLLENTIVNNDSMRNQIQFQILQKLVLWFLDSYQQDNLIKINKLGNLLVQLISKFKIENGPNDQNTVFQYLLPVYKLLGKPHQSEQNIIEINTQHIKKFQSISLLRDRQLFFLELNFSVIKRNNNILNSCLESLVFLCEYLSYQLIQELIQHIQNMLQFQQRAEDMWQCLYLLENCFIQVYKLKRPLPPLNCLPFFISNYDKIQSKILKIKLLMVLMAIVFLNPSYSEEVSTFIRKQTTPDVVPPYQNKAFCLYLIGMLKIEGVSMEEVRNLLNEIFRLACFEKKIQKEIDKYGQRMYTFEEDMDPVATNSYMKSQVIIHPLCKPQFDIYQYFRGVWEPYPLKKELKQMLSEEEVNKVKELWNNQIVGNSLRKILKVKRNIMHQ